MRSGIARTLLIIAIAGVGLGAGVDVERYEKTLEAKRFLKTLGFVDRYLEGQNDFLAQLAKDPNVSKEFHRALSKVLKESDYENRLADMAGLFLTREDLIAANKYNSAGVGERQLAMMMRALRMVKQGELEQSELGFAGEAFYSNLTDDERQELMTFINSPSGQRYWKALGAIDGQLRPVFLAILRTAIPKALEMWAEQSAAAKPAAPSTAPGGTQPARQETTKP